MPRGKAEREFSFGSVGFGGAPESCHLVTLIVDRESPNADTIPWKLLE